MLPAMVTRTHAAEVRNAELATYTWNAFLRTRTTPTRLQRRTQENVIAASPLPVYFPYRRSIYRFNLLKVNQTIIVYTILMTFRATDCTQRNRNSLTNDKGMKEDLFIFM